MWTAALVLAAAVAVPSSDGQAAVDRKIAEYQRLKAEQKLDAAADTRFREALDALCRQRDCAWSGLYWYTDWNAAAAEARRTGRPILSLRLLGRLDEEMSCANSRYFRTILYSNRAVADFMRANFVLYWSSERPAPLVTIDFGDGRVMRRTITGNSIHYLMTPEGRPLDAIPGLYAPKPFLEQLQEMAALYRGWLTTPANERENGLVVYHGQRMRSAGKADSVAARRARLQKRSTAWDAAPYAISKQGGEASLLENISFGVNAAMQIPSVIAEKVAPSDDFAALDDHSLSLIRFKRAQAPLPGAGSEEDLRAVLANLQRTLTADTLQNEYKLRPMIHEMFAHREAPTFETLNARVYSEVFATPREDPWLGLLPYETFTGLLAEGIDSRSR